MKTTDAKVFRANLIGRGEEIRRKANLIVNGLTFKLYGYLLEETRVDTGRMRAGWAIAVYAAGDYAPPAGKKRYRKPSADRFVARLEGAPLEAKRVIFNNVEYVLWWEVGTSRHAGDHMVKVSIQRLLSG